VSRSQTRSGGITASEENPDRSRRVRCGVRLEWVGGKEKLGLETGSLLCLGRDPGAPKGAKWALKRIAQGLDRGSGAGSEEVEDSTIRE